MRKHVNNYFAGMRKRTESNNEIGKGRKMSGITEFIKRINRACDSLIKRPAVNKEQLWRVPTPQQKCPPASGGDAGPRTAVQVIDVSGSMGTSDYTPTRLDGAIRAAIDYVKARREQSANDRIAIVAFHTVAEVVLPLTPATDTEAIIKAIRSLRASGGTDIAEGLKATVEILGCEPQSNRQRHVILLSDGQGGKPLRMARKLKDEYGATIDVVGIGGSPGAVNEALLRKVATTDSDGFCHYRFIRDSKTLSEHYRQLATGLIWRGKKSD